MRELFKLTPFKAARIHPVKLLVVHHIGSKDGKLYSVKGTISWFTQESLHKNPTTGKLENLASAHFAVPRSEYTYDNKQYDIIKFADDKDATYHAGVSSWVIDGKKVSGVNHWSLGWELEGDGNIIDYTDFQYEILIDSLKTKMELYKLTSDAIVGHEDVAPGRKVDPGKLFDWKRVRTGVEPRVIVPVIVPTEDKTTEPLIVNEPKHPSEVEEVFEDEVKMASGEDTGILFRIVQAILKLFKG